MKKILVILLPLLLLLSFTSCKAEGAEETISNYESFMRCSDAGERAYAATKELAPELRYGVGYVNKTFSSTSLPSAEAVAFAYAELYDKRVTVTSVEEAEGTIHGEKKNGRTEVQAEGVKIRFTYKCEEEEGLKGEIVLSGRLVEAETASDTSYSFSSISLQGKAYEDTEFTWDKKEKYLAATVGGRGVELRLLNAE